MTPSPQANPARSVPDTPATAAMATRIPLRDDGRVSRRGPSAPQSRPSTTHPRGDFHALTV